MRPVQVLSEAAKGVAAMIGCCLIWGLSGLYYKALDHVPAFEVIAHRTVWSMVLFGLIIGSERRFVEVWRVLKTPRLVGILVIAALMISVNWSGFVISIQNGWALEASLGYYILPLVAVLLGVLVLKEPMSLAQGVAVGLATVAVLILGVGLQTPPWIALLLATTFAIYGLIKRALEIGPRLSVFIEVLLATPVALAYLIWVHQAGGSFGSDLWTSLLLIGSGPMSAVPLILFTYAARRVNFGTIGLLQYLNPSLQFLVAVFVFGEVFTYWHSIALPLIWVALVIYSVSALRGASESAQ